MDLYLKAFLLGIIQGITEFLPISSTGHLILAGHFLDLGDPSFSKMFNVVIQFGSILSVILYFHRKLLPVQLFTDETVRKKTFSIWWKVLAGLVPILVIGGLFGKHVEFLQEKPLVVAFALLIGGILLLKIEDWCKREDPIQDFEHLSWKKSVGIGLIQCLAMIPGTSRSASTIIGGLALGASRSLAAEFSFFLAIPTMGAASCYSLLKHGGGMTKEQWIATAIGFIVSFFVAWGVIAWLMNFIKTRTFKLFGYYRIILGAVVIIFRCFGK